MRKWPYLWFILRIWRHGAELRIGNWHKIVIWKKPPPRKDKNV